MNFFYNIINYLRQTSLDGNTLLDYSIALLIFFGVWAILYVFKSIFLSYLKALTKKTKNNYDDLFVDILDNVGYIAYPTVSIYLASLYLNLAQWLDNCLSVIFVILLAYEASRALKRIFSFYADRYISKLEDQSDAQSTKSIINILWKMAMALMWVVVALLVMSNLGLNVTSLVASFGIGGIAIALAVQNILGDLLSAFSIYLDKPFSVGDFIVVGADKGTVEKIGLKSTRLRSITGEELVISNKELTSVRINNFKRMQQRRDDFTIGVEYGTPIEKLKSIPTIIKQIIDSMEDIDFIRCHFVKLADFSLNFNVVFFVKSADYDAFLDFKEQILLEIYSKFGEKGIKFAFPTQEIILKK
ncbi:MAG: mechanosensitive ion channel family protein [bacterium]